MPEAAGYDLERVTCNPTISGVCRWKEDDWRHSPDGVIAVIITIMVLELKAPSEATWPALLVNWPDFPQLYPEFIYVGIYWNNHHHMLHLVMRVNGGVLWANLFFLFWLSPITVCHGVAE